MAPVDSDLNTGALLDALPDGLFWLADDGQLLARHGRLADVPLAPLQEADEDVLVEFVVDRAAGEPPHYLYEAHCVRFGDGRLCLVRDVTARAQASCGSPSVTAGLDALTGLPEKQRLRELIDCELGRSLREGRTLALLCIELDGLTDIAGRYGPSVSGLVLQWAVGRLRTTLRASDQLGWHGVLPMPGEETASGSGFMLLLPSLARAEDALIVAERTVELLHRPFALEDGGLELSARIGIAVSPRDGRDARALWRSAAQACAAVSRGRLCRYADAELDALAHRRLALARELRAAPGSNALHLVYQPRIEGSCVVAVEALLRWQSTDGVRLPDEFLSLAEQCGLTPAISRRVFELACADLARWWRAVGERPPLLSVNLSATELHDAHLPMRVLDLLVSHDLPPQALQLEVAEETLATLGPAELERLHILRRSGVGLIMDHCMGNLALLATLPPGTLTGINLGRRLVGEVETVPLSRSLIGATLHLATGLGLAVTAVGVERPLQASQLKDAGCFRQQGLLHCAPLGIDDLLIHLRERGAAAASLA